jgi:IS1 family transposase
MCCITGWDVSELRHEAVMKSVINMGPTATHSHSDAVVVYQSLVSTSGQHTPHLDKSETYSVEGDNTELCHSFAQLVRRSRCFSRCIDPLRRAVRRFVWCWNQRQLWKRHHPRYHA